MTPLKTNPTPVRDRSAQSAARQRRSLEQIIEGVRRQRRHILMLDGVDPLRGGVAD
ncbi:hypothetical protein GGQ61_000637 [Phenylobacterium haematophilum]|jgi:hypothetical protein|uniref:Uncharacterized protein n=1 Tax=Phenylobacterium haematophilum TaxID=98513 RepID=A0A839ZXC4_9CAUL|nr:hypothetical protein [Phenylobacterium haematophilum]MBB3889940.1 hypothetical protein [Phenylobacterium haematophilum]